MGLWGHGKVDESFPLSSMEWTVLYRSARMHTVEGIVFDALQMLPVELLPPRDLMLKWTVNIDQIERHNTRMNTCIMEQSHLFEKHHLHPILLKGQGLAACYINPGHRICGDVDWYFEQKTDYRTANLLIQQLGIKIAHSAGFSTEYGYKGIVIEHHQRMFDIHNPFSFPLLNRLQRQHTDQKVQLDLAGTTVALPAPLLMTIQVNAHILKHLLSFGIGIRQLCDAARVYHTYSAWIDGQSLRQIYKSLGILKWIHLLHTILVKDIGLSPSSLPFELPQGIDADWMMDEIWMSGNFGLYDDRYGTKMDHADGVRSQATRRVWTNVKRYLNSAPMEAISFPVVHYFSKFAGN